MIGLPAIRIRVLVAGAFMLGPLGCNTQKSRPPNVLLISLDSLLARLQEVLGSDSILYHRFRHGLRHEDEGCLADAMNSLHLYPDEVRRLVEDSVMSWLFGAREDAVAGCLEA